MNKKYGGIKCAGCGSDNLKTEVSFDGLDEDSVAGEGSGYEWVVNLVCQDCPRVYPVCRVKNYTDVSDIAERTDE